MKIKKALCLALVSVMITAGIASALSLGDLIPALKSSPVPENALTPRPEEAVYLVLKLDDTSKFLQWLISEENINVFMPLILGSEDSNDIIGGLELARAFANGTPLKSAALVIGMNKPEDKNKNSTPFFQIAFTVDDKLSPIVKKISEGNGEDSDFSKLIFGTDSPLNAMAVTMLKTEKLKDNAYRIDNELFVKVKDEMILVAMSQEELAASLNALDDESMRLFSKISRRFNDKDFAFVHVDYETLDKLDDENSLKDADDLAAKFIENPVNFEFGFKSEPEKFTISLAMNIIEAMKKEFADKALESKKSLQSVKGAYMKPAGAKSPLLSMSGYMNIPALKDAPETKDLWPELVRQMKVRFGITEEEFSSLFTGPFALTVNDNVTFEGMKIPAVYISQTADEKASEAVFEKLTKTPHFHKLQDGSILQLDSSLSPVSCLVQKDGSSLGINFAELTNLSAKPVIKPALESLMNSEGISAVWIDFDEIRNWIMDSENGVFATAVPMAKMMGFGDVAEAVQDVLTAELSVPAFSLRVKDTETFVFEFVNAKINPENGLAAKLVKLYRKFSK